MCTGVIRVGATPGHRAGGPRTGCWGRAGGHAVGGCAPGAASGAREGAPGRAAVDKGGHTGDRAAMAREGRVGGQTTVARGRRQGIALGVGGCAGQGRPRAGRARAKGEEGRRDRRGGTHHGARRMAASSHWDPP
jgi:hypothetical protein